MPAHETFYEVMRRHGVTRRSFLKFCSLTAAGLGLGPEFAGKIAHALETKPRTPVVWLHGLECTCCTESFIRSGNPLAGDVILSMISLDYDDTIMAAAGHQAEEILEQTIEKYDGQFILACEGNPPLNEDGMYCIQAGRPYVEKLRHMADHCKAIIAWGSCASWGCVQAARPNPTQAVPIHKVILDKPIVKVPGCPPIAEVMTGVITYMLAFDRLPPLDRQGRPAMFYGQRLHDKCYRRPHFDAGQFVEKFDDEGARKGYCLYKVGCKGAEDNFWDKGSFYSPVTNLGVTGNVESTANTIGGAIAGAAAIGVAAHAVASGIAKASGKKSKPTEEVSNG
jgi:hydrogenase small subunit